MNFPTTSGAYDETYNGNWDMFVTRLSTDGSKLLYSTFLGGTNFDIAFAVSLGPDGLATVAGYSYSSNFPTTSGAYDETHNGDRDAFVARLSADGSSLLYSTFLGGTESDIAFAVSLGPDGSATIAGDASSSDFPTTPGAYDETHNGDADAFVARLSADGSSLLYSTFLGGTESDAAFAVAVGPDGSATVSGETFSSTFPTTPGTYDETHNGDADAFVVKLDLPGSGSVEPDLVITGLDPNPDEAPPGGSVSVAFSVLNIGQTASFPSQTNLRLGTSPTEVTGDDPLLAEIQVPAVEPGAFLEFQEDVTIPTGLTPGTYYLWAIADVNGTAGQTPEGELNDKVNVPFVVTMGDTDVFVYKVEFNQGTQRYLADPFEDDPVDIIPGKDLVVRYYLFGTNGTVVDYEVPLTFITSTDGNTVERSIDRNDGQESSTIPADPGDEEDARDIGLLAQRVPPADSQPYVSLNYVIRGDWLVDAESAAFVLSGDEVELARSEFQELQSNRAELVLHVYNVDSELTNHCDPSDSCPEGDGPLSSSELEERVLSFVRAVLPVGRIHIKEAGFVWDGGNTNDSNPACTELLDDLKKATRGEFPFIDPGVPYFKVNLAVARNFPPHVNSEGQSVKCRGEAVLGDASDPDSRYFEAFASSLGFGEVSAHEVGHTIGLLHAGNSHGERNFETWPYPHGIVGAALNDFGMIARPVDDYPQGEDPGEWDLRVLDPCPGVPFADRGPCPLDDSDPLHDLMSYGQSEYDMGPLESAAASRRRLSPLSYGRLYLAVRDAQAIVPLEPLAQRNSTNPTRLISAVRKNSNPVDALVISGVLHADGEGNFSPVLHRSIDESFLTSGINSDYSLELYDVDDQILIAEAVELLEYEDQDSGNSYFSAFLPFAPDLHRIILSDAGVTLLELTASENSPTVQVISPNGGESYSANDSLEIAWDATDIDGDELSFIIQYSADSGTVWQTLGLVGSSASGELRYPASDLQPRTEALIRVSVTDGLRTAEDVSDAVFVVEGMGTGIGDIGGNELPSTTSLGHVYPNPVGRTASVAVELESASSVNLEVFDILGRKVAVVAEGSFTAGTHAFEFDTSRLANGVYIMRGVFQSGESNEQVQVRRFTVLR